MLVFDVLPCLNDRVDPTYLVDIEALHHTFRTRHWAPPTDKRTTACTLSNIDNLTHTKEIAKLPPLQLYSTCMHLNALTALPLARRNSSGEWQRSKGDASKPPGHSCTPGTAIEGACTSPSLSQGTVGPMGDGTHRWESECSSSLARN